MSQKILVGPMTKGLRNDVTAFNVDNDSFPTLVNAYQWRGRIKRKRGTYQLNRLTRFFQSTSAVFNPGFATQMLVSGSGNLITGFGSSGILVGAGIVPGSVAITDITASKVYTDPSEDGTLIASGGTGTINYSTGAFTITGGASHTVSALFQYYPNLPVLGLEDFLVNSSQFPGSFAFDTTYSYNISTNSPYEIYNISFYKNPPTGTYAGYVQKTDWTPYHWNGQDYQQFWSTNYQGAFWVTNGLTQPFTTTNIGMQFLSSSQITSATQTSATTVDFVIPSTPLVVGDFVFANEFTGSSAATLNFQTGYVTAVNSGTNTYTVTFPNASIGGAGLIPGILQYLTNVSDSTKDCIRWCDGLPNDNGIPPTFSPGNGWVNFCPPLSNLPYTIEDAPSAQYYLVGAKMILPFKDRLLFIGPVIQTSSANSQIYLQDTVVYSQNGTPYYTASFTGGPSSATTYFPILTPTNQSASPQSYWEDQTGLGGFISAGYQRGITTASPNEDVIIMGFGDRQARFAYTGSDLVPFNFYIINSELGSESTFSLVNMDRGIITVGGRGVVITSQIDSKRIDLDIPDQVFQFNLTNNGSFRVCAQRDYINEWIYFTYPSNSVPYKFPNQTLTYNYRDNSWAIFNESYTTYGTFRKVTGDTWSSLKEPWETWQGSWVAGEATLLQPQVMAGNAQGFVMIRDNDNGTGEGESLEINNISGSVVTSNNHCLNTGDYIVITGALGTVGSEVNGKIFSVADVATNLFTLNPTISSGTYLGNGTITRMYVPYIQTKQFPVGWDMGRKTRIGVQQYLFTTTPNGQITLLIFLSQNANSAYNTGPLVPDMDSINDSLIYATTLYTCPEGTNLGLTPSNINLQIVTSSQQAQTWHRMNTSLIGDTVQIGFTLNDDQMRDDTFSNQFTEIELHSFNLSVSPSQLLV